MNTEEYHKMHALERDYWWFQGRRRIILNLLDPLLSGRKPEVAADSIPAERPRLLDIGCGTGLLLTDLSERGNAAGLDFSPLALHYCRSHGLEKLGRADVRDLPVQSNSIDLLTAIDLVEHIKDDVGLMGEFSRVLRRGGHAVLSVPAHPYLWSGHDVALHHFRRYRKPDFRKLIEDAGLEPIRYTYSMSIAYAAAVVFRPLKRMLSHPSDGKPRTDEFRIPPFLNATLKYVVYAEAAMLRHVNMPAGLSLLCIARKPTS